MSVRNRVFALLGALFLFGLLVGCGTMNGNPDAKDPMERGLSYVAEAICFNAVMRAIFNK